MLQINRDKGRVGADGKFRLWTQIETDFLDDYASKIEGRLEEVINKSRKKDRKKFLNWCKANVRTWMVAKPREIQKAKKEVDKRYDELSDKDKKCVLDKLKWAYNYKNYRPVELAGWLNVKTCPYCNMQYTLYALEKRNKGVAVLQYDHFISQTKYPMFSMSLYNLIPSCGACNNGKGEKEWNLAYHPYYTSIGDKMRFRVKNPLALLIGREEAIEIQTVHPSGQAWKNFDKATHVEVLYKRHQDVAHEVFGRAYAYRYYKEIKVPGLGDDNAFWERILKGFYPNTDDIEKRPLTKLQQDLWKQVEDYGINIDK